MYQQGRKDAKLEIPQRCVRIFSKWSKKFRNYEKDKTLERGDLEFTNSRILELEEKVKRMKKQIKNLSAENLSLNIYTF